MTDTTETQNGPVWVVAHTMPRCEKKFADVVLRDRFEYELPLLKSVRRYRTQTKRFTKPLFPGYVFVKLDLELKNQLYLQDLVVRIINIEEQESFVEQLEAVKKLVATDMELILTPPLEKGTRVRIAGGALHGVEGVVDNPEHPKGIVVSVDVLRQGVLVPLKRENLEIIRD